MKSFIYRYFCLVLSLWTICPTTDGQNQYPQIQATLSHYSTDDGMPSNAVSDLQQDAYGYLWIATWNGLSRFDGFHFYNYETGSSSMIPMLHNRIIDLRIDSRQNIWMRMYDGRIFVLNRRADRIENPLQAIGDIKTDYPLTATADGAVLAISHSGELLSMRLTDNGSSIQKIRLPVTATCMAETQSKGVWIGTDKGQILVWHKGRLYQTKIKLGTGITCLSAKGDMVFAGTADGKIIRTSTPASYSLVAHESHAINYVFADSHKQLWFAMEEPGILRLDMSTMTQKHYAQNVPSPQQDAHGVKVVEMGDVLWMSLNHGGFGYYNREKDRIEYVYNDPGTPWNLSNTTGCFLVMKEGVVWESTSRRGLEKLVIMKHTIKRTQPFNKVGSPYANDIRSMFYDTRQHQLLIGSKSGQIIVQRDDRQATVYTGPHGQSLGRIYHINSDSRGNYWICTKGNGLYRIEKGGKGRADGKRTLYTSNPADKWSLSSDNVYCSTEDKEGNIWIATYDGGVNILPKSCIGGGKPRFINPRNALKHYPSQSFQKVRTLTTDAKGNVWVGTTDGLLVMTFHRGVVSIEKVTEPLGYADGLHSYDIVCLATGPQGDVWIGTNGGGLSHCLGKGKDGRWHFETFDTHDGLPSEEVRSITFDHQGFVWFSTDHTLCSFDTRKKVFSTFGMEDGVDDTSCSESAALTLPDGRILFGTINGYYTIDRHKLNSANVEDLKLHFTDFYLNDRLISPRTNDTYSYYVPDSTSVELPTHSSVFSFRFASLNYKLQQRIHYQYKLEGHDNDWHNASSSRMVSYSGVPTGHYKLVVRAYLLEAPEKYAECHINVTVPPYFLLSARAVWIYILAILIAALSLFYLRQQQIKRIEDMRVLKVGPQEIAFTRKDDYNFVKQQLDWLEQHYADSNLKTELLVAQTGMSRTSYYKELKQLTGLSPKELILDFRIKKAQMYLSQTDSTVAEIAYKTGFNDPVYFTRLFRMKTGMTPTKFREGGTETDKPADPETGQSRSDTP